VCLNQCIVEPTNISNQNILEENNIYKPMYNLRNQYILEETDVSKPMYSCGNQCKFQEPHVYLNKPVYKGANPCTLDQSNVSKPVSDYTNILKTNAFVIKPYIQPLDQSIFTQHACIIS